MSNHIIQGEENLGMAMTFTLVSHLREELLSLVNGRIERQMEEEKERERRALEVSQLFKFYRGTK